MSLTRRSFVKKSSYSAAAVTILGKGYALNETESYFNNTYHWSEYQITVEVGIEVILTSPDALPNEQDWASLFQENYFSDSDWGKPPSGPPLPGEHVIKGKNIKLTDGGISNSQVGEHRIIFVMDEQFGPGNKRPEADRPQSDVQVHIEQLEDGSFKYTIKNLIEYIIVVSNRPEGEDDGFGVIDD